MCNTNAHCNLTLAQSCRQPGMLVRGNQKESTFVIRHWRHFSSSSSAYAQSDQGPRCPLTESFDTIECSNEKQMPGGDFARVLDDYEPVHFAHDRRHIFAWRDCDHVFLARMHRLLV